jgi:hypothetical protein
VQGNQVIRDGRQVVGASLGSSRCRTASRARPSTSIGQPGACQEGIQVDAYAVRVEHSRVLLAPERAGARWDPEPSALSSVQLVDIGCDCRPRPG